MELKLESTADADKRIMETREIEKILKAHVQAKSVKTADTIIRHKLRIVECMHYQVELKS